MENHADDEEIKAHLASTNPQYQSLCSQHAQLKQQVEEIERKAYVTEADELEEQRLKKLKLYVKDQMNELVAHQKHATA